MPRVRDAIWLLTFPPGCNPAGTLMWWKCRYLLVMITLTNNGDFSLLVPYAVLNSIPCCVFYLYIWKFTQR